MTDLDEIAVEVLCSSPYKTDKNKSSSSFKCLNLDIDSKVEVLL